MRRARYPDARSLQTTADCGGSNGARVRLWKRELQALANELRVTITVCHLPPGTGKWNRIEYRLFSFITQNWRGKPPPGLKLSDMAAINLLPCALPLFVRRPCGQRSRGVVPCGIVHKMRRIDIDYAK